MKTDTQLQQDVNAELKWETDIEAALKRRAHNDAQSISVDVKGSDVTLSGTVRTWGERDLANHAAWNTPGVWNVVDKISVTY